MGYRLNTLLTYMKIRELYRAHKHEDVPDSVVLRKYIYPVYPISRKTLKKALTLPLEALIEEIKERENKSTIGKS